MAVTYKCDFCGRSGFSHVWRCPECGQMFCDACTKGGRSSTAGKVARGVVGYVSAGLSEVARAGYRKAIQKCPSCQGVDLIRV